MKIAIIGYPESGKIELAKYLEKKYYCSTLYLDELFENNDVSKEVKNEMLDHFMKENISWVIEGDYVGIHFDERMKEADKIVIMKANRFACLIRYLRKQIVNKKKINKTKIKEILFNKRKKIHRQLYRKVMRVYNEKTILLFNQTQAIMLRDLI